MFSSDLLLLNEYLVNPVTSYFENVININFRWTLSYSLYFFN